MQKIGYGILVSIYLASFSIGKELISGADMSSFKTVEQQNVLKSIANDVADGIGMNDFFDSLSRGL